MKSYFPFLALIALGVVAAILVRRRQPLRDIPPWLIDRLQREERQDRREQPKVYAPQPPPPPDEDDETNYEPTVIDYGEDE